MWQELKKIKVQSEALRYNLNNSTSSNQQKNYSPPENKNKMQSALKICAPPFCDGMSKGNQNHQKEVAVKNVETMPNPLVNHESHQERLPKSVLEPPKQSRHDPMNDECLNHPK